MQIPVRWSVISDISPLPVCARVCGSSLSGTQSSTNNEEVAVRGGTSAAAGGKAGSRNSPVKKRVLGGRSWCKQGIRYWQRKDYEVLEELKVKYPVDFLCKIMGINRSGYYKWKSRQGKLNRYEQDRILLTQLLHEEHELHPCGMGGEKRLRKPVYLLRNETMPQKQCANTQKINKNLGNI